MNKSFVQPLVSICLPIYNGAEYLGQALDSILMQTYNNIEIIISDDNSEDTSLLIVEDFKKKASFPVKIYKHIPDGIGANWNNCLNNANGDYIKFLFQDDVLEDTCIEKMVKVLNENPKIGLVACKRNILVDENYRNKNTKEWIERYGDLQKGICLTNKEKYLLLNKSILKDINFHSKPKNKIGEPTVTMFRRSLLRRTGNFNNELKQILDLEFYLRVLKYSDIAILKEPLASFRLHENQTSHINKIKGTRDRMIFEKILFRKFFWLLPHYLKKKLFKKYHFLGKLMSTSKMYVINGK